MRIKVYRAASAALAMAEIRDALGLDALILSTTTRDGVVEVTAAIENDDEPLLAVPLTVDGALAPGMPDVVGVPMSPEHQWTRHNLPPDIAAALDREPALAACGRLFRFGALPLADMLPPIMLVGPPGAGKTLTVAKLATRLVLAGQSPMIITADDRKAGGVEQLAGFTRLLDLTLIVAGRPDMLGRALSRRPDNCPVLIDAPALDPRDTVENRTMIDLLAAASATPVLVLPAGIDPMEAADLARAHADLGTRHLIATRLDRNGRLGGLLAAARAADLILTEAGISAAVVGGLEPLTPRALARRLCHGADVLDVAPPPAARTSVEDHRARAVPDVLAIHIAAQAGANRPTPWKALP